MSDSQSREEERWIGGDDREAPSPWAALWRDRGLLVIALAALALLAVIAVKALSPGRDLLREVKFKSERGATVFNEVPSLAPGERFRLDLRLGKPSAILVFVEDPEGAISQVHPAAGEPPLIEEPRIRLPPGEEAWEAGGLEPGNYCLWIFAAPGPFTDEERESIRRRLDSAPAPDGRRVRSPPGAVPLPGRIEVERRPFVVMLATPALPAGGAGRRAGR